MLITDIAIHIVRIPFSFSVNHNLKKRKQTESIVIELKNTEGLIGYGEGAPRLYVTGESIDSLIDSLVFLANSWFPIKCNNFVDITRFCQKVEDVCGKPSLVCALEMALLDLLGKSNNKSISDLLKLESTQPITYSAIIPFLAVSKLAPMLEMVKKQEFSQVKLKVGSPEDEDILALAREILGDEVEIRLDANRAWNFEKAVQKIKQLARFNISCIEEPLVESEIACLPRLSRQIDIPFLLDESLYTLEHASYYSKQMVADKLIFNLKISKTGGLSSAHEIYQFANERNIRCGLGCNVGETAILSAAGRTFAQTHELSYVEGSYASYFMEDDIGTEPISFGKGGTARPISGAGLGIEIDQNKLDKYGQKIELLSLGNTHMKTNTL